MPIVFEMFDVRGLRMREAGLERVVVRRRELDHHPGSQVAILARHGPLLMQSEAGSVRLDRDEASVNVPVEAGILEVVDDVVRLVIT